MPWKSGRSPNLVHGGDGVGVGDAGGHIQVGEGRIVCDPHTDMESMSALCKRCIL